MVTRLDRLARSTRDLLNVLHEVAQGSAAFKSLHDHWADTTTPHGRLMLTILAFRTATSSLSPRGNPVFFPSR
jgi:DNA invertase Pin-like site-specific DNA recombinase